MKPTLFKILILGLIAMLILSSCNVTPGPGPEATATPGTDPTSAPADEYDDNYVVSVYPKPVSAAISENEVEAADASVLTPDDRSFDSIFTHFGFSIGDGGLPVELLIDASLEEEEYKLTAAKSSVKITASCARGIYNAVSTLRQLCKKDRIAAAEISDKPAIPLRGVIEGFYGTAWTHEFRLDLFRLMGKYKMNAYIYAPKDDPKHRAEWRSMYTGEELGKMKELVNCAAENYVRFIYAISPGIDISFGTKYDSDFAKLTEKCQSMYDLGVRDFAILLDDITNADAKGHAKLVNDFQNKFVKTHEGCSDLIMITTEYCDAFITAYSSEIAPLIQSDIKIMWTGQMVIPDKINDKTLARAKNLFGRKLFIWWNYPVNDTMANNMFMGPCEGLGKAIGDAINGLVSNPMNQGYASMLPLLTTSDFLWNPADYSKEDSLVAATEKLAPRCADGLYAFADLCRASVINGNRSSLLISNEAKAYLRGVEGSLDELKPKLEKIKADLASFRENGDAKMLSEVKKWLTKAETMVDLALQFIAFEKAEDSGEKVSVAVEFAKNYRTVAGSKAIVSNDVLVPFIDAAKDKINVILGKTEGDAVTASSVSTNMQTYLDYVPENAVDGSTSTYFWSSGAPSAGSTFTYDLGRVADVTGVKLTMGASGHADDYIRKGVIEYSSDDVNYTTLCSLSGKTVSSDTAFSARYIRIRCTASQTYWAIISELEVTREMMLPKGATFDGSKVIDLSCLFDKNLFTGLDSKKNYVSGKTLTLDVSGHSTAEFFFTETGSVAITVTDESGSLKNVDVSDHTSVDLNGQKTLTVKFSGTFNLAEIVLK
ncbi:MAG: beta-N-acetylglucosaminidase domain-containing protein [Clostridia bacterium]|nr:beta-N-acetylglucosaminidase domain-containing protein [Clostridia bacterium]